MRRLPDMVNGLPKVRFDVTVPPMVNDLQVTMAEVAG